MASSTSGYMHRDRLAAAAAPAAEHQPGEHRDVVVPGDGLRRIAGSASGGRTTDCLGSAPQRRMQTLRKLPIDRAEQSGVATRIGRAELAAQASRSTSYRRIPAATATLSDSTPAPAGWRPAGGPRPRERRPDPGALVAQDQRERRPAARWPGRSRGSPSAAATQSSTPAGAGPGEQLLGVRRRPRAAGTRAHAAAQHLRVGELRRALERHDAGGAEPERGAEHVPTLPGSCTPSSTSTTAPARAGRPRASRRAARSPRSRPAGARCRPARRARRDAHLDQRTPALDERALERRPRGVPSSAGRDGGAADRHPGRERLLHQAHAFGQRQPAALAAAAAVQIADQRLRAPPMEMLTR